MGSASATIGSSRFIFDSFGIRWRFVGAGAAEFAAAAGFAQLMLTATAKLTQSAAKPAFTPKIGSPMRHHQGNCGHYSRDQAAEHAERRDAFPIKTQDHAGE